jgi:uncharacterized membrane protein
MTDKYSSIIAAAKTTLVGGAIFLVPGFLALYVVGKVFGILVALAAGIGPHLGITGVIGGILLNLVAITLILLVCLLGGLLARRAAARRMRTKLDQMLLGSIPGYALVKNLADNLQQTESLANSFVPVLVRSDDVCQMAFETDRTPDGIVAIYMPGAPNPWSGNVVFVSSDRVHKLPITISQALKINSSLGRGSEALAAELEALRSGDLMHVAPAGSNERPGTTQVPERRSAVMG